MRGGGQVTIEACAAEAKNMNYLYFGMQNAESDSDNNNAECWIVNAPSYGRYGQKQCTDCTSCPVKQELAKK